MFDVSPRGLVLLCLSEGQLPDFPLNEGGKEKMKSTLKISRLAGTIRFLASRQGLTLVGWLNAQFLPNLI